MIGLAISIALPTDFSTSPLAEFARRVVILDSTSFQLPAAKAEYFRGSGGSASQAAVKIKFGVDIKSGQFFYLLQDGTSPDNCYSNGFMNHVRCVRFTYQGLRIFKYANLFGDAAKRGVLFKPIKK
jgi:hypothetical protein